MIKRYWAFYDDMGEVVRIVDYPAEGAKAYPPEPYSLPKDHPDWDEPLF